MIRSTGLVVLIWLLSALVLFSSIWACGGSDKITASTTTRTPTPPAISIFVKSWVRCRPKTSATAVCEAIECQNDETQLDAIVGFPFISKEQCSATTFYEVCYDYSKDGSNRGTCQPDYIGCSGSTQISLYGLLWNNDPNCLLVSQLYYARCVDNTSKTVTCRPEKAKCAQQESWLPMDFIFDSLTSCTNYGVTATGWFRCVKGSQATCKLSTIDCDTASGEIRSPNALYVSKQLCDAAGSALYDLCYDYTASVTTDFGKCQPIELGCDGPLQTKILSGTNEPDCGAKERSKSLTTYIRCRLVSDPSVVICRPSVVRSCKADTEILLPVDVGEYTDLSKCLDVFELCYDESTLDSLKSVSPSCIKQGSTCDPPNRRLTELGISVDPKCKDINQKFLNSKFSLCLRFSTNVYRLCRYTITAGKCPSPADAGATSGYISANACWNNAIFYGLCSSRRTKSCECLSPIGSGYCDDSFILTPKNLMINNDGCSDICPVPGTETYPVVDCRVQCTGFAVIGPYSVDYCIPLANCAKTNFNAADNYICTSTVVGPPYNDMASCLASLPDQLPVQIGG